MNFPERRIAGFLLLPTLLLLLYLDQAIGAEASRPVDMARALFQRYVTLSDNFDSAVADLYRDDARIIAFRKNMFGGERRMQLTGAEYKALIRKVMPLARLRDDRSAFTDVRYEAEAGLVRIHAQRYSVLKKYTAPYSMLVGRDQDGRWRIREEVIHAAP